MTTEHSELARAASTAGGRCRAHGHDLDESDGVVLGEDGELYCESCANYYDVAVEKVVR